MSWWNIFHVWYNNLWKFWIQYRKTEWKMAICSPETVRFETEFRRHFSLKYYSYLLRMNNTPIDHSTTRSTPWELRLKNVQFSGSGPIRLKNIHTTRQIMYVKRNIQARSCNHCCSGQAIIITFFESVFLALGIQHANIMYHIVICGLYRSTIFFTLSHKQHDCQKKSYWTLRCVFSFLPKVGLQHYSL